MPFRKFLCLIFLALLIGACAPSTANTYPTLAVVTIMPISTQGSDLQFKSSGTGEPRSAGYWLIWNTCAQGNQSETARANGGRAEGWTVMDNLLADPGILVGEVQVGTCQQGENLLQSRNSQGNEMAKDGAYLLAAQLLAAQLNLAAGAEYCPASDQTVSDAQSLLLLLGFDGTQGYLGPPLAVPEAETAKVLTEQLVSYNAGTLCMP